MASAWARMGSPTISRPAKPLRRSSIIASIADGLPGRAQAVTAGDSGFVQSVCMSVASDGAAASVEEAGRHGVTGARFSLGSAELGLGVRVSKIVKFCKI